MIRPLVLIVALVVTLSLLAQSRIDAGVSIGQQGYENYSDDPRVLTSIETLMRRDPFNVQVALEYANLADAGKMFALHNSVLYRYELGSNFAVIGGAGATYLNIGTESGRLTWNASAEVAYHWDRAEVFARVRQYDFTVDGFRSHTSPEGPAVYLGMRFVVRR